MKKSIKALSVILTLILSVSLMSFTAFADEELLDDPNSSVVNTPVEDPEPDTPQVSDDTDSQPEQTADQDIQPDNPVSGSGSGSVSDNNNGYDDGGDDQSYDYNDYDYSYEEEYYYFDEEKAALESNNDAGSVSEDTVLYNTPDMNDADYASNKWKNITINADADGATDDGGDFAAIKSNTSSEDNGQWILYLGIALIVLSLLGIIYFIVATVTYKKRLKAARRRAARRESNGRSTGSSHRQSDDFYIDMEQDSSAVERPRSSKRHYSKDDLSYSERKRMKSDTAEIYISKRYAKK